MSHDYGYTTDITQPIIHYLAYIRALVKHPRADIYTLILNAQEKFLIELGLCLNYNLSEVGK